GLPPRSRARAPLRGRRPLAAVHLPQALARPRADRDLLLHPRGDHARARVARRALRPLRRAGGRERGGDGLPRGAALPALRREAPLRARVLVALRAGRRNPGGLRRAARGGDRPPLPPRRLPRRHGRRLLLRRLPTGVDPLDPAPRPPRRRDRRGLVAARRDRRAPALALLRGDAPDERGGRRATRLRAARRQAARRPAEWLEDQRALRIS